jgi:hypothetical protein
MTASVSNGVIVVACLNGKSPGCPYTEPASVPSDDEMPSRRVLGGLLQFAATARENTAHVHQAIAYDPGADADVCACGARRPSNAVDTGEWETSVAQPPVEWSHGDAGAHDE